MKFIAIPQMLVAFLFYSIHFCLSRNLPQYNFTFIRWYIADVLALIFCIPLFVNSQVIFRIRNKKYITIIDIAVYFIIFSLYFEIIMPKIWKHLTADMFDIVAYAIGGIILYFSQPTIQRKIRNYAIINRRF